MIYVMSAIKNMMPIKRDSEQAKYIRNKMQPIPNKDEDYKEKYLAIVAKNDKLEAELEEYRNLVQLFEDNQKMCEKAKEKCENFMRVVLSRYEEVKQFKNEERERNMRLKHERENVQREFKSLIERIKEKDSTIQRSNSENKKLMEQLSNVERDYHELIEERRSRTYELEQELASTKEKLEIVSNALESTKQEKLEKIEELEDLRLKTIATIERNTEQFNRYMDQVAGLHSEINNIILRSNPGIKRINRPVRSNNYREQLDAMKGSITQLDELTTKSMEARISQEDMDEINRDNEQLRGELEGLCHRLNVAEAKKNTYKSTCRHHEVRTKELEKNVNSYAKDRLTRQQHIHLLHNEKLKLTAENSQYQDQIKVLQKDVNRLQDERDKAVAAAEEAKSHLDSEPLTLIHNSILSKDKFNDIKSQLVIRNRQIKRLNEMLNQVKMVLQDNVHLIQNNHCLLTLLTDIETELYSINAEMN